MKVIIWGCGDYGKLILANLINQGKYEVIAYTDSKEELWGQSCKAFPIIPPDEIQKTEYDAVMIAVSSFTAIDQIKDKLLELNIPEDKIIDIFSDVKYMDLFMDQRFSYIRGYAEWVNQNHLEGNVAECGVFRGDSAKFINRYFTDKKLYLCDTFEGFDGSDLQYEKDQENDCFNNSRFANESFFGDTGIKKVMDKMLYPENVIIKKGYFPDSVSDIDDKFCFINLDMDLHIPMLNGLRFFWDKMVDGGCILLHDYFSDIFPGVKQAVDLFEQERGIQIAKTPIGDGCSLALLKQNNGG